VPPRRELPQLRDRQRASPEGLVNDDNILHLPWRSAAQIPPREDRDWVTSTELVEESGISYRQADYWTRTGLIRPLEAANPGSGCIRRFPEDQITRATTIRDLLVAGIALQIIREVIDQVTEHHAVRLGAITITHHPKETA
jgi:DNA-binding transcriptional MerR regulator